MLADNFSWSYKSLFSTNKASFSSKMESYDLAYSNGLGFRILKHAARKQFVFWFAWRTFIDRLFIFLLHGFYFLASPWQQISPKVSYKRFPLVLRSLFYHADNRCLHSIFSFLFHLFIFYLKVYCNQPRRYHPLRTDLFRWDLSQSHV